MPRPEGLWGPRQPDLLSRHGAPRKRAGSRNWTEFCHLEPFTCNGFVLSIGQVVNSVNKKSSGAMISSLFGRLLPAKTTGARATQQSARLSKSEGTLAFFFFWKLLHRGNCMVSRVAYLVLMIIYQDYTLRVFLFPLHYRVRVTMLDAVQSMP